MRYGYKCDACGSERDVFRSMSEAPQPVACECSATMHQTFNANVECCVKGGERPFSLGATSMPIGWDKGNTGDAQERRYKQLIDSTRKEALKNDRQAIKGGIRHIAKVPREFHRMRTQQYGKAYLDPAEQSADSIKEKLKSDGLLFKN
jgi:putative FmdB family regulatory protein